MFNYHIKYFVFGDGTCIIIGVTCSVFFNVYGIFWLYQYVFFMSSKL